MKKKVPSNSTSDLKNMTKDELIALIVKKLNKKAKKYKKTNHD